MSCPCEKPRSRSTANSPSLRASSGVSKVVEVIAEDVKSGVHTSFPQAVKLEPDEIVVVSWISFRSREDRDRINPLVMKDPLFANMGPDTIPVDGKRMFWG